MSSHWPTSTPNAAHLLLVDRKPLIKETSEIRGNNRWWSNVKARRAALVFGRQRRQSGRRTQRASELADYSVSVCVSVCLSVCLSSYWSLASPSCSDAAVAGRRISLPPHCCCCCWHASALALINLRTALYFTMSERQSCHTVAQCH